MWSPPRHNIKSKNIYLYIRANHLISWEEGLTFPYELFIYFGSAPNQIKKILLRNKTNYFFTLSICKYVPDSEYIFVFTSYQKPLLMSNGWPLNNICNVTYILAFILFVDNTILLVVLTI